ncbi:membrane protein [Lactobacillus delbrueckii]|nr:membrane protein [Lactobacillus delbrueckii]
MILSEKIIDLLVCFVAFVVFAVVVSIYPEEMFALLIATVLLIGIYAVAKELVKDWLKHNHRFGV